MRKIIINEVGGKRKVLNIQEKSSFSYGSCLKEISKKHAHSVGERKYTHSYKTFHFFNKKWDKIVLIECE